MVFDVSKWSCQLELTSCQVSANQAATSAARLSMLPAVKEYEFSSSPRNILKPKQLIDSVARLSTPRIRSARKAEDGAMGSGRKLTQDEQSQSVARLFVSPSRIPKSFLGPDNQLKPELVTYHTSGKTVDVGCRSLPGVAPAASGLSPRSPPRTNDSVMTSSTWSRLPVLSAKPEGVYILSPEHRR